MFWRIQRWTVMCLYRRQKKKYIKEYFFPCVQVVFVCRQCLRDSVWEGKGSCVVFVCIHAILLWMQPLCTSPSVRVCAHPCVKQRVGRRVSGRDEDGGRDREKESVKNINNWWQIPPCICCLLLLSSFKVDPDAGSCQNSATTSVCWPHYLIRMGNNALHLKKGKDLTSHQTFNRCAFIADLWIIHFTTVFSRGWWKKTRFWLSSKKTHTNNNNNKKITLNDIVGIRGWATDSAPRCWWRFIENNDPVCTETFWPFLFMLQKQWHFWPLEQTQSHSWVLWVFTGVVK